MYLQDWEGKGWFDVVMDFEGIRNAATRLPF